MSECDNMFAHIKHLFKNYPYLTKVAKNVPKNCHILSTIAGGCVLYTMFVRKVLAKPIEPIKLTFKEKKFIKFASVEYDGQIYMTPLDFIESTILALPRERLSRKILNQTDIEKVKQSTPEINESSPRLFRNLANKGLISYTEYLFLLSILIKPQSGFKIAFNMFDTNANQEIDKNEFLVLEKIFSQIWKEHKRLKEIQDQQISLHKRHNNVDTTLLVHFFGPHGSGRINYEDFEKFMINLQREILETEFNKLSHGTNTISEKDFATILLRHTHLDSKVYLQRLLSKLNKFQGITFEEFQAFNQLLNNIEDFIVATRLYYKADHPISKDEFQKTVKICVGKDFSSHLIDTIFALFDEDNDGRLSYKEFIGVMKDRRGRGIRRKNDFMTLFKKCIRFETKPVM